MKLRRIISAVLSASILVLSLASCGKQDKKEPDVTSADETTVAVGATPEETSAEETTVAETTTEAKSEKETSTSASSTTAASTPANTQAATTKKNSTPATTKKSTTVSPTVAVSHKYEVDKNSVTAKIGKVVRAWKLSKDGIDIEIHRVAYGSKITQYFTPTHGDGVDKGYEKTLTYQPYVTVAIINASPDRLGIASAQSLEGKVKSYTEQMSQKAGALIAINGEGTKYYHTNHTTIRNGKIELQNTTEPKKYHKYLLIHKDGTWDYGVPTKENADQLIKDGVYNTLRWQYELITNGVRTTRDLDNEKYHGYYHNRTVFGQISKNQYVFILGEFMPIRDVITVMQAYGIKDGHLISGGNCASMYVKGIGNVTGGAGRQVRDLNKVNYLETEFFANHGLLGNGSNGYQKMGGPCEDEVDIIYFK